MKMIKRLRFRLITASMLSLALVLTVILGAANILNYRQMVNEADEINTILAENEGEFPDNFEKPDDLPPDGMKRPGTDESPADGTFPSAVSPENGQKPGDGPGQDFSRDRTYRGKNDLSVETPFESRYFYVTVGEDGTYTETKLDMITAVDEDSAAAYADTALASGKTKGFIDSYRYLISSTDSGKMIIFLDRWKNIRTIRNFLLTSGLIALVGLAAVFLLILLFSGRIIRPFVDNYEKQRRFITDAGHELKTPLAIINADAEVLEMEFEEENEWINDIKKQTMRLSELTANLIALSRMEENASSFVMIEFPVSDVVSEAAESYKAPALAGGKTFTEAIDPDLTLCGDEKSIRQLVGILMDNALKYTDDGGVISLGLTRRGKYIRLSVSNTCEKIDRAALPHLFDRFYRTDTSRNSAAGGYGIGLSIAHAIVEGHKGKINAESTDERSLTITALLPAGQTPRT